VTGVQTCALPISGMDTHGIQGTNPNFTNPAAGDFTRTWTTRPDTIALTYGGKSWTAWGAKQPGDTAIPTGACCLQDGSCVPNLTAAQCPSPNVWQGANTSCSPNPCPQPSTGACCLPNGTCSVLTSAACASAGGIYQGNGFSCVPNPCAIPDTSRSTWRGKVYPQGNLIVK
jgi:hypothetical protein